MDCLVRESFSAATLRRMALTLDPAPEARERGFRPRWHEWRRLMASIDAGAPLPGAGQDRVVRPRSFVARNGRVLFAWALLAAILLAYIAVVPQFRPREQRTIANSGLTLAAASLGQTMVVLTGGIDLSIGPMVSLTNSIASATTEKDNPRGSMVKAAIAAPGRGRARWVHQWRDGGVRAVAADHRDAGDRLWSGPALHSTSGPHPGVSSRRNSAIFISGTAFQEPAVLPGGLTWGIAIPKAAFVIAGMVIFWLLFRRYTAGHAHLRRRQ